MKQKLYIIILLISLILSGCSPDKDIKGSQGKDASKVLEASSAVIEDETPSPEAKTEPATPPTSQEANKAPEKAPNPQEANEDDTVVPEVSGPKIVDGFVLLSSLDKNLVIDLKYATQDNFTGQVVYPTAIAVLRTETAEKLAAANRELMALGYRIKVWDAYRPVSVQVIFWDLVQDSRYVANPYKGGSIHNKGSAVDITLVDSSGKEVEMPSGFDDFSERASRNNPNMSSEARKNMQLLTDIMVKHGFTYIDSEWWHFNDSNAKKYDIVDIDLSLFLK
ncbi:M15 family metallopeptidase [Alloiococcus sp. CFN-8]|uniref:M15 family metallopeptidase n=1 Tax=Alloiococcus sp. CFN-8 TaxID=3416081 RepID=UPI003CEBAD00